MTETSKKVWKAFWENTKYPENIDPWNLANALREVVVQLQYYQCCRDQDIEDMVLDARAILDLCDELEKL
jgi:hypothetical protein